jgi:hypothetical protein
LESSHGISDGGLREEACEGGWVMIEIEIKSETESSLLWSPNPFSKFFGSSGAETKVER